MHDAFHGASLFEFEDLEIGFYRDEDPNGRRVQFIDIQYAVSKEKQYLNALKEQEVEDLI
jgi:hypothetical protein